MPEPIHHYGAEFNTNSANIIIPLLTELFNPSSVIDIGCGIGTWLEVFRQKGIKDILGVDGKHVLLSDQLLIPRVNFKEKDLRYLYYDDINKKFDLALCLEVAEHLEETYADNFIKTLCTLSTNIIFSAAVPGQTGENHFNEQYPTYWAAKFRKHDYVFIDLVRPKFWNNAEIEWWYRQNTFVVMHKDVAKKFDFTIWDEKIYIIKDLLEMYIKMVNLNTTSNASLKSLFKKVISNVYKKIVKK